MKKHPTPRSLGPRSRRSKAEVSAEPSRIARLDPSAARIIERYTKLRIGGKHVVAPYFMNPPGRKGRRVLVGKGTPSELERATARLAKKHGFDLVAATPEEIRAFMIRQQLGIDCSGLVAWISHALTMQHANKSLWDVVQFSGNPIRKRLVRYIRPIENISAKLLTDNVNAISVSILSDVRPGDIIRSLNGNHVLLVTEIAYDANARPLYFKYVNSTEYDGLKYGVRHGLIRITDPGGHLLQQEWVDSENGVNWIFKAANDFPDDTRVVRLRALA